MKYVLNILFVMYMLYLAIKYLYLNGASVQGEVIFGSIALVIALYKVYKLIYPSKEKVYSHEERLFKLYKKHKKKILKGEHEEIYILSGIDKAPTTLSKYGGKAVGVNKDTYPRLEGKPMQHVLTLDFQDLPLLQKKYPTFRAVSLFISDFVENEAYELDIGETQVVFLSQHDIDTKKHQYTTEATPKHQIKTTPVKIPKNLFALDVLSCDREGWEYTLYKAILNINYASGSPIWLQDDSYGSDGFIAQFDNSLEASAKYEDSLNLANGIMYMYEDNAFWQMQGTGIL